MSIFEKQNIFGARAAQKWSSADEFCDLPKANYSETEVVLVNPEGRLYVFNLFVVVK